jgi:hypothetical protein
MHALIENGEVKQYPYGADVLRRDNPQVSFPRNPTPELLAEYGVFPVKTTEQPQFDPMTQRLEEGAPVLHSGEWVQVWNVTPLSAEEIAQRQADHAEQVRQQRAQAYREESDPLFFKWPRGEATEQDWLDKIAEIKTRFPDAAVLAKIRT